MVENRVLRRIFGTKRDEVTGEWRKLHYVEYYDLYSSPNTIWMIKSVMRWAGNRELWGRQEGHQGFGGERDHFEDARVDGRIILRWIFRKWVRRGGWT